MSAARFCAVLTGASGGIGHAMAIALAGRCNALLLVGRDLHRLAALQKELLAQRSLPVAVVAGDLTDDATRQRIHDAAGALPAPVDLLINNAGVNEFHEFESQSPETMSRLMEINLVAPMHLTHKLLPLLRRAPRAQIVNVGSIFGYLGYPGFAAYCASKFGLRGFSQALRRELADTAVSVRYFAPRATATALNSPAVAAMNRELRVQEDSPDVVAGMLLRFLDTDAWECKIGFPESFYAFLNQLLPVVNDNAIGRQLKTIRKHLPGSGSRWSPADRTAG
ncbi:MAG TPA: SDR family oxidoreductase [Burkholderiales bacterium]|jgi:short-subunit dehydrogenase|nr:SDR family oxidoreductase [Burkholderiales bacterium]